MRIRIGNDIVMRWGLTRQGADFAPDPSEVRLWYRDALGRRTEITDYTIEGSEVVWTFRGSEQRTLGDYTLTLVGREGQEGMYTIDTESFTLVPRSPIGEQTHCGDVEIETISMQSELNMMGAQGEAGYTPQKGVDYWTDEDVAEIDAAVTAANNAAAQIVQDTDRLTRDLAQYDTQEEIELTLAEDGKAITIAGQVVAKEGYQTSNPVRLKKGCTYLFEPSDGEYIDAGVALCARYTTEDVTVMIDYSYTYDEQDRIATATADYDSALVYTYTYADEDADAVITDAEGNEVVSLPQTRVVAKGSYVPMFKSLGGGRPRSGYYAVLANEDMLAVWSAPEIEGCGLIEVSYGIIRSLVNQKEDKAAVKKLAERVEEIAAETDLTDYQKIGWDYTEAMWWMAQADSAEQFRANVAYSVALYDRYGGIVPRANYATIGFCQADEKLVYAPALRFEGSDYRNIYKDCPNLLYVGNFLTDNGIECGIMMGNCKALRYVGRLTLSQTGHLFNMLSRCTTVEIIRHITLPSEITNNLYALKDLTSLRFMELRNLGASEQNSNWDFSSSVNWGSNTPQNLQSLRDTLILYSKDRVAAGWDAITVKLSAKTYALLTEDELAQIAAKGITLTT